MDEIVTKLGEAPSNTDTVALAADSDPSGDRDIRVYVSAKTIGGQRKRAEVWTEAQGRRWGSRFAIMCDEGKAIGGEDSAPPPLAYLSAGIAF
jgi:hypothetical protein